YAYLPQIKEAVTNISSRLAPILLDPSPRDATEAAKPINQRLSQLEQNLLQNLSSTDKKWVPLNRHVTKDQKQQIEQLNIIGLGFDQSEIRYYPEGSSSAQILGFVGHDDFGR